MGGMACLLDSATGGDSVEVSSVLPADAGPVLLCGHLPCQGQLAASECFRSSPQRHFLIECASSSRTGHDMNLHQVGNLEVDEKADFEPAQLGVAAVHAGGKPGPFGLAQAAKRLDGAWVDDRLGA
jgi:hypothetical protein